MNVRAVNALARLDGRLDSLELSLLAYALSSKI